MGVLASEFNKFGRKMQSACAQLAALNLGKEEAKEK